MVKRSLVILFVLAFQGTLLAGNGFVPAKIGCCKGEACVSAISCCPGGTPRTHSAPQITVEARQDLQPVLVAVVAPDFSASVTGTVALAKGVATHSPPLYLLNLTLLI